MIEMDNNMNFIDPSVFTANELFGKEMDDDYLQPNQNSFLFSGAISSSISQPLKHTQKIKADNPEKILEEISEKNREQDILVNFNKLMELNIKSCYDSNKFDRQSLLGSLAFSDRMEFLRVSRRLISRFENKKGQILISKMISKRNSAMNENAECQGENFENEISYNFGPSLEQWYDIFIKVLKNYLTKFKVRNIFRKEWL